MFFLLKLYIPMISPKKYLSKTLHLIPIFPILMSSGLIRKRMLFFVTNLFSCLHSKQLIFPNGVNISPNLLILASILFVSPTNSAIN